MGRNKKEITEVLSERISIPFTTKDRDIVNTRALELGMKTTEYIRYLIQTDLLGASIDEHLPRIG